ncbi:uncharacterized protein TNCV_4495671 [Trichonephila clavipes]|nr:uncharacterized protein TNCV_4495671 [Trichonephila clavipes]
MPSIKLSDTEMGSEDQVRSKPCSSSCNNPGGRLKVVTKAVCQNCLKVSDSGMEMELVIPFAPHRNPKDRAQQSQFDEVVHYHQSE